MYTTPNRARERIPIHKSEGITPTEKYLNGLCERTFLSLWSYPGIYRDQKERKAGHGKELCDMLVVFGEHVLIFSDKHCLFPSSGNLKLDWQRWYKKTIKNSADQAWGAERWLKSFPRRVYLDRACAKPFPLDIPSRDIAKYHLIVVAHGSEGKCIDEFGGSGSLLLASSLGNAGNIDELSSTPFTIGDLDRNRTYIHVLTETTLDIILHTLDTISDFVCYLHKKELFMQNMISVNAPGEEELLAYYLGHINGEGVHDFVVDRQYNAFALEEGFWEKFSKSSERQEQLKHNQISYCWDDLIERFSLHAINATQYYTDHLKLSDTEKGLRFMASESRTRRRNIINEIINVFANTPDGTRHIKGLKPLSPRDPFYVFLCLPRPVHRACDEYREVRRRLLEACIMVVKYIFPEALDILGIASEPQRSNSQSSEDLLYMDAREWSDELNDEAAKLQKELKILTSPTISYAKQKDYPESKT